MAHAPDLLSTVWAIAEIVCEQGRVTTALLHGKHFAVADYYCVTAYFDGADLVRLKAPELDFILKRYTTRTDSFSMPTFFESGHAYRFDQGDILSLNALLRDLKLMQPSSLPALSFSQAAV